MSLAPPRSLHFKIHLAWGVGAHSGEGLRIGQFSSVQSLSHVRPFVTPWTAALQASLSITNSRSLLRLMSIESLMPSNHLILCRPLLIHRLKLMTSSCSHSLTPSFFLWIFKKACFPRFHLCFFSLLWWFFGSFLITGLQIIYSSFKWKE